MHWENFVITLNFRVTGVKNHLNIRIIVDICICVCSVSKSCPTLCDLMGCSTNRYSVWEYTHNLDIRFNNRCFCKLHINPSGMPNNLAVYGKFMPACMRASSPNHVWLFVTPWTVTHQAPLLMGLPRQEPWSRMPFPSPGHKPVLTETEH